MRSTDTNKENPRRRIIRRLAYGCGTLAVLAVTAAPALADPVHVTAGYFIDGEDDSLLRLVTSGFTIGGASDVYTWRLPVTDPCDHCTAGATVNVSGTLPDRLSGGSIAYGDLTLNGTHYDGVSYFGSVTFTADPYAFPVTTDDYVRLGTRFTMNGTIRGEQNGTVLFSSALMGQGVAASDFVPVSGGGYGYLGTRYDFTASPVPEPASMLLIGTGLAGLVAARRRRSTAQLQA